MNSILFSALILSTILGISNCACSVPACDSLDTEAKCQECVSRAAEVHSVFRGGWHSWSSTPGYAYCYICKFLSSRNLCKKLSLIKTFNGLLF